MGNDLGVRAIILAGGRGTRLEPYTSVLPKPLMPIGDRAILEITVDRLVEGGISDITLCVGHLAHLIEAVFNGRPRAAQFRYVREESPLGTAGPLRLVDGSDGDVSAHERRPADRSRFLRTSSKPTAVRGNVVTIATHERRDTIDYGVLHVEEGESPRLVRYEEKPEIALTVSMGIYVLEPSALEHVPAGLLRLSRPDSCAARERRSASGRSRSPATGSTSDGATTTSRRSSSGRSDPPTTPTE